MGLVKSRTATLMGGVALAIVAAQGVAAQNVNATNVTLLERLVIGAGAPKVAIDTPQAVTVVSQEDIDAQQAMTTGEVLDGVPGITMIGSERLFGESFNIRGIGTAETSGDEARIAITVDGAKKFYEQYRMGSFFSDPELYKQVEVLRGPASSTLYGAGAMGGVINFTTKDASDFIADGNTGAFRVKSTYDSNGDGTLVSGVLAHRINETFEVLAAGNFRRSDLMDLANGGELVGSAFEAWSGLIKGTMHLDDDQTVRLSYQRWNSDADDQAYAQTGTVIASSPFSDFGRIDRTVDDQTAVLGYENKFSDNDMLDLKLQLSYSDTSVEQTNPSTTTTATIAPADYGYKTYQFNGSNTSTFTGDNWVNYLTYGIQASYQDRVGLLKNGGLITTHPEGTSSNIGIFVQSEHTINDALTIIGGARGDFASLNPSSALPVNKESDDFAFSPKLATIYDFNENFSVFGSVAHTERMPTLDEMYQYNPTPRGPTSPIRTASLDLTKEQSNNFEIGFSTQAGDILTSGDTFGLKTTGFYNDITDGIAVNPTTTNGLPYFVNIAAMRIWGVEIEAAYDSDYVFGRLAYTFTRGEYGSDVSATLREGMDIESLPQDRVVATLGGRMPEYDLEFGTKVTVAADPLVAVATVPATAKPDGWATMDLFASWKPQSGPMEGLTATFGIDNVFNADYRENLSMDRSKGRTFKLTLAKQFDY
nr:TonB-dependent receptor [uncultured Devosia sp.]